MGVETAGLIALVVVVACNIHLLVASKGGKEDLPGSPRTQRTAASRVRRATEYATTPKMPASGALEG